MKNIATDDFPRATEKKRTLTLYTTIMILSSLWSMNLSAQTTAPTVITGSPSTVEATIATLNGTVTPDGGRTTAQFDYGTTPSYGSQTPADTIDPRSVAFSFNGSTHFISYLVPLNLLTNTSFTIEAWAKRYPNGSSQIIFGAGNYGATNEMLQFGFKDSSSGNVFTFSFYNDDLNSPTGYTDTLWHQWVGVFDQGADERMLYRDGVLVASDKPGYYFDGTYRPFIGSNGAGGDNFVGKIADVRVWTTALSQSTIQQWMYKGITSSHPNYGNLVGYWKMDEDSGSVIYDSSPQSDSAFVVGTADWTGADWTLPIASEVTGLTGATAYHFRLAATNSAGSPAGNDSTFTTLPGPPTVPATNLNFSNIGEHSATIQWTDGGGEARLVVVRQDAALDASNAPVDGTIYTADSLIVAGSEIGTKGYVVFATAGNSVTVTGLVAGHNYTAAVYEMNNPTIQPSYTAAK